MINVISIIIIAFSVFAISRAILRFKDGHITLKELVFWAIIWLAAIMLSLIPSFITAISGLFGIERGVDLAIYISILLLFYLIFRLYVKIENVQHDITRIVRELAKQKRK